MGIVASPEIPGAISCRYGWLYFHPWRQHADDPAPKPGFTNFWRLAQVYSGSYHDRIKKLHEKHGPIVRIGPNLLDLDYPELIKTIYSTDGKWLKVGTPNLSDRDAR